MNRRIVTLIAALVPIVVFGSLGANVKVPYAAVGPGPTYNTLGTLSGRDIIELTGIEPDEFGGNLNMTTVAVRTELSLFDALGFWIGGRNGVVPLDEVVPPGRTNEEVREINRLDFERSEREAERAALRHLDYPFVVQVAEVSESSPSARFLESGDVITTVNGTDVFSAAEVPEELAGMPPGSRVEVGFLRAGEPGTVTIALGSHPEDDDQGILGIAVVDEPQIDFEVAFNVEQVGGPSAGLMLSLALIDKLTPGELTGGRFIAGTGTIDTTGAVGPIGGIRYKLIAAREEGATEFLVPGANCREALSFAPDDLTLVRVDTLDDAVNALAELRDGGEVAVC
ncbi:PDZ domain-containing protein [Hoyosella sp. YIM 151337]|uniref:YlbL family protein n=1 Tax=Hoyosella sp. YIM 151337 TaxID=2992742 RepID=UPI002235B1FA|nr:PDZ domain-containing protein [Hoyosella sp. YIM 151337]MCW4352250.1 PDZ domain-containing protein [Hoyosella sp. YIM 151337]